MRACVEERAESLARVVESRLSVERKDTIRGLCACARPRSFVWTLYLFLNKCCANPNGEARSMLKGRADAWSDAPRSILRYQLLGAHVGPREYSCASCGCS